MAWTWDSLADSGSLERHFGEMPFDIVWANDVSAAACKTYRRNLNHYIHHENVWDALGTLPKRADVVIRRLSMPECVDQRFGSS